MLHNIAFCPEADGRVVSSYLRSLADQRKRVRKIKNREMHLQELFEAEFKMIRKRQLKEPDTPRKKKLRDSLTIANKELKQVKKAKKNLLAEKEMRKAEVQDLTREVETLTKDNEELQCTKMSLERKHADTLLDMEQMNTNFKPFEDDVDHYARGYDAAADELKQLECKYAAVTKKLLKCWILET